MAVSVLLGTRVKITASFKGEDGSPADPSAVTFYLRHESVAVGTPYVYGTAAEIERTGTGSYILRVTPAQTGVWYAEVWGTGVLEASKDLAFSVKKGRAK